MREQQLNRFVFGLLQPPEHDSEFGEKCLYLSLSSRFCSPSCTAASCLDISHRTWRLPCLDCPKISFFFEDIHAGYHVGHSLADSSLDFTSRRVGRVLRWGFTGADLTFHHLS